MAKPTTAPADHKTFAFETKEINVSKLLLDPNNYRFLDRKRFRKKANNRFHEESVQKATLDSLEDSYQLDELKQSILVNGYVPMERIIVVPYSPLSGFFVVVEGNRRVASLKALLREGHEGDRSLTKGQIAEFSRVPCAVLRSSGMSLRHIERIIMGIRHIAGPKEWGAYQQALLVTELRDEDKLDFKEIGEALGIPSLEAARRYRAIGALKRMEADELYGRLADPSFYRLFHELISLPEPRKHFGWSAESNAFTDIEKARLFFELITPNGKKEAKIRTFGDVRKLKNIIGNKKAEQSLFNPEEPFSDAARIADEMRKSEDALSYLDDAKSSLSKISFVEVERLSPRELEMLGEIERLIQALKRAAGEAKKN